MPGLLSIQIAKPSFHGFAGATDLHDKPWETAFFKQPITGHAMVTPTGLVGDGQADSVNHGGVDKAICCYASEHFPHWRSIAGLEQMGPGGFGENFTTEGLIESEICIGDIFTCGTATFQITQPRQPCWKLSRRWRTKSLSAWVEKNGLTGWYFRVLSEGTVKSGDTFQLVERFNPGWSIARANEIAHHRNDDREQVMALAHVPHLSASWREGFSRLAKSLPET